MSGHDHTVCERDGLACSTSCTVDWPEATPEPRPIIPSLSHTPHVEIDTMICSERQCSQCNGWIYRGYTVGIVRLGCNVPPNAHRRPHTGVYLMICTGCLNENLNARTLYFMAEFRRLNPARAVGSFTVDGAGFTVREVVG